MKNDLYDFNNFKKTTMSHRWIQLWRNTNERWAPSSMPNQLVSLTLFIIY